MNRVRRFGVLFASMVVAACASAPRLVTAPAADASPAAAAVSAAMTLDRLYDDYFEDYLARFPTAATDIGDHRYDDRFENPATPQFEAELRAAETRFLDRALAVDPASLTPAERISYDVFVGDRRLSLASLGFPERLLPINQMNSLAIRFALLGSGASAQPFATAADYDRFLGRAQGFVRWADSSIAAMRDGLGRGVVQPRVVVQKMLPQLRALARDDPEQTVFWQPVKGMPDAIGPTDRERIAREYRRVIAERVVPAYRRIADFLENEYLPGARATVAWTALPDGAAWYRFHISRQTTTNMSAEEIHALGLGEVARIRREMETVMRDVGFKGDLAAFFEFVQRDERFFFARPEQLIEGYRALQGRIDALLPKLFSDFPKANYEVRAVEPFRAASAAGASYWGPSADGKRPGIFYINTFNLRAQPIYGMETLSLHEASPGHHFQVAIQRELTVLPRFRRFTNTVVYSEGWALYAESIGKELGLFTDPMQWYGRLNDEMLRAMRLVVDTGLHAKGWSREQAIQYMRDNSSLAESDVTAEVERYIAWPAQALGYKVGQLRISAMRARAERELGARFDVREFHSQVLRDGSLPMTVLEAKIERWIAARRAQ
jgi:uncharacterized protein (DUF885 family)